MLCSASVALRWVKLWWFGVGDRSPVTPKDDDSVAASQNCLAPLSLSYLSTPNGLEGQTKGQKSNALAHFKKGLIHSSF